MFLLLNGEIFEILADYPPRKVLLNPVVLVLEHSILEFVFQHRPKRLNGVEFWRVVRHKMQLVVLLPGVGLAARTWCTRWLSRSSIVTEELVRRSEDAHEVGTVGGVFLHKQGLSINVPVAPKAVSPFPVPCSAAS